MSGELRRSLIPVERIERAIVTIRGQLLLLDQDLALFYGVETRILVRSVKRHPKRFPADCMLQLTAEEWAILRSQFGISRSWGGRRHPPYAFTPMGVSMLSSVLQSDRAIERNLDIMRAFVHYRQILGEHRDLARRVDELEKKTDVRFRAVFVAIRKLLEPAPKRTGRIGFSPPESPPDKK